MVVIITDVYYKMALAAIRDLGEQNIKVVACQSEWLRKENPNKTPLGFYSKYTSVKKWLPDFNESPKKYIEALYDVCKEYSVEDEKCVLIPVGAKTLNLLAEEDTRKKFSEFGLLIPTKEQLDLYNGKMEVAELAKKLAVPVPEEYSLSDSNFEEMLKKIPIPCVVKPNCGEKLNLKAEQRYFIVKDRSELRERIMVFYNLEKQYPVVQEYVAGQGYGLSILAKNGKVIDFVGHKRVREYPASGGPSTCCAYQEESLLIEYAKRFVEAVNYSGIAMFEFKNGNNGFRLLEINPRVWGTYPMTRVARTQFTYNWYASAYNTVNKNQLPIHNDDHRRRNIKMRYFFADLRATLNYFKKSNRKAGLQGLADFFKPSIKDGVIEGKDFNASFHYIVSLFKH